MEKFKPNLIINNNKGEEQVFQAIERRGEYEEYIAIFKKDGVRLEILDKVLGRSLKEPRSVLVKERFSILVDVCKDNNIIIEGEFFSRDMKMNEIQRFYSCTNVASAKEIKKLENKEKQFLLYFDEDEDGDEIPVFSKVKDNAEYVNEGLRTRLDYEFPGRSVEWLSTFHESLKFWFFDGFIKGEEHLGFEERMSNVTYILSQYDLEDILVYPMFLEFRTRAELEQAYELSLELNYEGLVIVHKDHPYECKRSTHKEGALLKLKNDEQEFDGVILQVSEGTVVKEGTEKTTNELGRSVTSKKKGDRVPSGMAKTFKVLFENESLNVTLKGFSHEDRREVLKNKDKYIGRHFKYTGMPGLKKVPRHAKFLCWRDEK